MVIKYYYAVRIGKKPGVYRSWAECKEQVHKFSNAKFKKFADDEEAAYKFVYGGDEPSPSKAKKSGIISRIISKIIPRKIGRNKMVAYIDGSYNNGRYGSGVVTITDEDGLNTYSFSGNDKNFAAMKNIAGEILAARHAVEVASDLEYKELDLYFDYEGIECWATGAWKTNKEQTRRYASFMRERMKHLKINFYYVKSHSGNKYNEMADKLAKEAVGLI